MSNVGILMLIFAIAVFLAGLYMFTGHPIHMLTWRVPFNNMKKEGWIETGKWTMVASIFILIISILCFIFHAE